jgi:hypothetical protein
MAASTLGSILCCCVRRDKGAACRHHRPVLVVVIGEVKAGRTPPILQGMEQRMQKRRRIQQAETPENGLTQAVVRLRQQAGQHGRASSASALSAEHAKLRPLLT